jgi:large subunit ribosomal protein L18
MTRGKVRVIGHRRRRQGRTDYRHRLGLLKSGRPRLVVRRSINSISCQLMEHSPRGDRSIVTVTSRHLDGFGWKGPRGNLSGAYLTGLLCGVKARGAGVKSAVLDTGLHTSTRGSRIYSTLKGALDAGLEVPHSPEVLPSEERLRGAHIDKYMESRGKKAGTSRLFDLVRVNILKGKASGKGTERKAVVKKPAGKAKPKPATKKAPAKRAAPKGKPGKAKPKKK